MKSLLSELQKGRILISDGAWGTQLHELGLKPGECPELWNIEHYEEVLGIAKGYIDAGSHMIETNSFGSHPIKLAHYGLEEKAFEINKTAAEISRSAAGDEHFVLGSIGPTGVMLAMGEVSEDEVYDGFCLQAKALSEGGSDVICVETMQDGDEARLAVKAAKDSTDCEIICTFTFAESGAGNFNTMMGLSVSDAMAVAKKAGADIIGSNCGNGIEGMVKIIKQIRETDSETPVIVQANAGLPVLENGVTCFKETPEQMAGKVSELKDGGVNIIGGCCGTSPAHISAMVKAVY